MSLDELTLTLFAACNSLRMLAYLPQIRQAAVDRNGASGISCTTWSLFLVAHLSTVAYAIVNQADWGLAACFAGNAICCIAIIAVVYWKRRAYAKRPRPLALGAGRADEPRSFAGSQPKGRLARQDQALSSQRAARHPGCGERLRRGIAGSPAPQLERGSSAVPA
jgi:hypothetical protein